MSGKISYPYYDPEFDTHYERIHGAPCITSIDNERMEECTLIKVDSVNKHGVLLDMIQVLTEMNFQIIKSYISSDYGWCMDVFHVRDLHGNKLTEQKITDYLHQNENISKGLQDHHTFIEIIGKDHPTLFSEITTTLSNLHCNITEARIWSHNTNLACIAYISDQSHVASIENNLSTMLCGTNHIKVKTTRILGLKGTLTCTIERRLHQLMMLSIDDFDEDFNCSYKEKEKIMVTVESCKQRGYTIVNIECKDHSRLMFDIVCTLTDMDYDIFHAYTRSQEGYAFQEYFIKHVGGYTLNTTSEKERLIKFIKAAIERRVYEGVRLEVCAENRVDLLYDMTQLLRENGLVVVRVYVKTNNEKKMNTLTC
ncbi:ACT domain-containing protein ACR3 [Trifolium repens]|nr:ACT domain-containing protein ACR3 [Trifolium repens]